MMIPRTNARSHSPRHRVFDSVELPFIIVIPESLDFMMSRKNRTKAFETDAVYSTHPPMPLAFNKHILGKWISSGVPDNEWFN